MKPLQAYRCPVCGRYFNTEDAFDAHADGCSGAHGDGYLGKCLYRLSDDRLEVFIPQKNTAGYLEGVHVLFESTDLLGVELTVGERGFATDELGDFMTSNREFVGDACQDWMENVSALIKDLLEGTE